MLKLYFKNNQVILLQGCPLQSISDLFIVTYHTIHDLFLHVFWSQTVSCITSLLHPTLIPIKSSIHFISSLKVFFLFLEHAKTASLLGTFLLHNSICFFLTSHLLISSHVNSWKASLELLLKVWLPECFSLFSSLLPNFTFIALTLIYNSFIYSLICLLIRWFLLDSKLIGYGTQSWSLPYRQVLKDLAWHTHTKTSIE